MNSIKEVYENLKKYDTKKQITISDDNESIELKINDEQKIVAWDDYLNIELKNNSLTHWHPDCDEIYLYFLKIIKGIETIPTKKDINKSRFKDYLIIITSIIMALVFCELIGLENTFFRIIVIIITIILLHLIIGFINKTKNKFSKNYVQTLNESYPLVCEDPSMEKK